MVAVAAATSSQASTRIGRGLTKNLEFAVSSNGQRPHRNRKNSDNANSVNYDLSDVEFDPKKPAAGMTSIRGGIKQQDAISARLVAN